MASDVERIYEGRCAGPRDGEDCPTYSTCRLGEESFARSGWTAVLANGSLVCKKCSLVRLAEYREARRTPVERSRQAFWEAARSLGVEFVREISAGQARGPYEDAEEAFIDAYRAMVAAEKGAEAADAAKKEADA